MSCHGNVLWSTVGWVWFLQYPAVVIDREVISLIFVMTGTRKPMAISQLIVFIMVHIRMVVLSSLCIPVKIVCTAELDDDTFDVSRGHGNASVRFVTLLLN